MIVASDTFQIRFGIIDQKAAHFRALAEQIPAIFPTVDGLRFELLIDISGPMYSLHQYSGFPSLQAWECSLQVLYASAAYREWFKDWKQYLEDGSREFYPIEKAPGGWSGPGAIVMRSCFRALEWRVCGAVALLSDHGALLIDLAVASRHRVMTEAGGRMFNVVQEIETPDLRAWEVHRRTLNVAANGRSVGHVLSEAVCPKCSYRDRPSRKFLPGPYVPPQAVRPGRPYQDPTEGPAYSAGRTLWGTPLAGPFVPPQAPRTLWGTPLAGPFVPHALSGTVRPARP